MDKPQSFSCLELGKLVENKNFKLALKIAKNSLRKDPKSSDAMVDFGNIYAAMGKRITAKKHYQKALLANKNCHRATHNLTNWYSSIGDYENAHYYIEQTLFLEPYNYLYLNTIGNYYADIHEPVKAEEFYKKALEINPKGHFASYNLIRLEPFAKDRRHYSNQLGRMAQCTFSSAISNGKRFAITYHQST